MKLSVIICTFNRDKYIYNVLKSIAENDFSRELYEIVLVDNNCTDNTPASCKQFQTDYPDVNFTYIVESNQGLSYARNRGIQESTYDIIIYVDDDALVNIGFLRAYYDFFEQNSGAVAAGGPVEPVYESNEPSWMSHFTKRLITGYVNKGSKMIPYTGTAYPGGGNAAFRKTIFDSIGGFNVDLGRKGNSLVGAEEKDVFDKIRATGGKFYYIPTAVLYHIIPDTKLSDDYFYRLTYAIGVSERKRTKAISNGKFLKRLLMEEIKWWASLALFIMYLLQFSPQKGYKLLLFRWNVSKGLLGY